MSGGSSSVPVNPGVKGLGHGLPRPVFNLINVCNVISKLFNLPESTNICFYWEIPVQTGTELLLL